MALAHHVFFSLKNSSPEAIDQLLSACKKYLTIQPGIISFACGTREKTLERDVNITDWDVSLHIIFAEKKYHDDYQIDHTHEQFVAENKDNWSKVQVFDSII